MDQHHNPSQHEANTKKLLQEYLSQDVSNSIFKEFTINVMMSCYKVFSSGLVSGKTLIDVSFGPIIVHLLSVSEFFEDISILKCNDASITELKLWKNKDPEAFDWTHNLKLFMELKGMSRDGWKDTEEMLSEKVKNIVKNDFSKTDSTNPSALPRADCVTCMWGLEMISMNHEEFRASLRKMSNLLKHGGNMLLYSDINSSHFRVGEDKYHLLNFNDDFLRKSLMDEGFTIVDFENLEGEASTDGLGHEQKTFVVARKVMDM